MKSLFRSSCLVVLLIPFCEVIAQDAASLDGKKVIVVASDVKLGRDDAQVRRAQYGDIATVSKVNGQNLWLQEKGGWIPSKQVILGEGAMQTWNKRFQEMQDQPDYDVDVALKFAAALSAYNQTDGTKQVASQVIQHDTAVAEAYRLRGLCLMLDLDFPAALADFQAACVLKPKSADLRVNLAICKVGVAKFDAAIEDLTSVLKDEPNHVNALYQRGGVYKLQGQPGAALSDFEHVLRLRPQHVEAIRKQVDVLRALGAFDRAIASAKTRIKAAPDDSLSYILLGDIYRDLEDGPNAVDSYSKALAVDPNQASAWSGLGFAKLLLDEQEEAFGDFTKAVQISPEHVPALIEIGRMILADGNNVPNALGYLRQARKVEPQNADVHAGLGDVFIELDQLDKAIEAYSAAIKIAPDAAWLLTNRGLAFELAGHLPEALTDYTRAIELDPDTPEAWHNRGNVYTQQAIYDKAIADYTQSIAVDPEWADLYCSRADAYMGIGDTASLQSAVADCKKAIALDPDDFYARAAHGYAHQELGLLDTAIADFRKAVLMYGPEGKAQRLLGYALYLNGDHVLALEELTSSIAFDGENAESWRLRGVVHRDNGNNELSLSDLLTAVDLAPDAPAGLIDLSYTYDEMWKFADALECIERVLQVAPEDVAALNYRAYIESCGPSDLLNPERAVADARKANRLSGGEDPDVLDTLACAYAAIGEFKLADETGRLAIAKAVDDPSTRADAMEHLELFKRKLTYRLPEDRPIELEIGPPVDAVVAKDGAIDFSFVPAECFAALHIRPNAILASPHLKAIPVDLLVTPLLDEFGTDVRLVEEILVPMFPSRQLPPGFLIRFSKPVGPELVAPHPSLSVAGWAECEYSGRLCYKKFGRVTCFVDAHTVITGPRASVKRMLATDDTPSLLRNALGQTKNDGAMLLQVEFSVCPEFIADASKEQAMKVESAFFAASMPDATSFTARLTMEEHVVLAGRVEMNNAIAASRLNLSLNEALQSARELLNKAGNDVLPLPPPVVDSLKTLVGELLATTTLTSSGTSVRLDITTNQKIESGLQSLGQVLSSEK